MQDGLPLVVVSRPADRLEDAVAALESRGLRALGAPLLEAFVVDSEAFTHFATELSANRVDMTVFTSAYGLPFAEELAWKHRVIEFLDLLRARHTAAIGPRTAEALRARGLKPGLVAAEHTSGGLARDLAARVRDKRVALLRSARGDPALARDLEAAGAEVLDVPVYDLRRPPTAEPHLAVVAAVRARRVDAYAFTSPLTVQHLVDLFVEQGAAPELDRALAAATVAAIGPPTALALSQRAIRVDVVPPEATFPALADALAARLLT